MTQPVLRSIHNTIEEAVSMRKAWKPLRSFQPIRRTGHRRAADTADAKSAIEKSLV